MLSKATEALRAIDAYDRIGARGVFDRLTAGRLDDSGDFKPGVGATPSQAVVLCGMLNREIGDRVKLMASLENTVVGPSGETAWDRLLAMEINADELWKDGRRPGNIAFALDDIMKLTRASMPSGLEWLASYVDAVTA